MDELPVAIFVLFELDQLGGAEMVAFVQKLILGGVVAEKVALDAGPSARTLDERVRIDGLGSHDRLGVDGILEELGAGDQLRGLGDGGHIASSETDSLGRYVELFVESAPGRWRIDRRHQGADGSKLSGFQKLAPIHDYIKGSQFLGLDLRVADQAVEVFAKSFA